MVFFPQSDGRVFTNYQANCSANASLMEKYNLKDNHEYRTFMHKNGDKVLKDLKGAEDAQCSTCPSCGDAVQYFGQPPK